MNKPSDPKSNPSDLFKKLVRERPATPEPQSQPEPEPTKPQPPELEKRRGRPATGKRSDPDWVGRTYYIKKQIDLDIESELLQLKRQGIELDKSELVNALLEAWVKWQQGENIEIHLSEISPRRNSEM